MTPNVATAPIEYSTVGPPCNFGRAEYPQLPDKYITDYEKGGESEGIENDYRYYFFPEEARNVSMPLIDDIFSLPDSSFVEQLDCKYEPTISDIYRGIYHLTQNVEGEIFEDGIESPFATNLMATIKKYGNLAIDILETLILKVRINSEVASEILRWIGIIDHPPTYNKRFDLLVSCLLKAESARVRDGAVLGISSLDDIRALPHLKKAMEKEPNQELLADMQLAINDLQE